MLSNYNTLSYLCETLRPILAGNAISEAFSQEKDRLVFRLANNNGALVISCDKVINTLYHTPDYARARANSVDVLPGCVDQTIEATDMHPSDRVITIRFESGYSLDLCFFGGKANVFLLNAEGIVKDAFKDARDVVETRPLYREGEVVYDVEALRKRLAMPRLLPLSSLLKETFPALGPTLVKELMHRASIPPHTGTLSVTVSQIDALQTSLAEMLGELTRPHARVYCYANEERRGLPAEFSIIPLAHLHDVEERIFENVHEAIRFYIARTLSREAVQQEKQSILARLHQKLGKISRTIAAIEDDLRKQSRADDYQRYAHLLMSNLHTIQPGARQVDVHDGESAVTIPLEEHLTAVQNAQRYYEKAKRSRTAQQQATQRLHALRAQVEPGQRVLQAIASASSREELKRVMTEHQNDLRQIGVSPKESPREQLPFRMFTVDGGFEVWAGKSSRNNDELTLKHAKPNDLWFHARGAAGSHVILKIGTGSGEPSKKAKEQAAGIAAYYSKMKNAKMVPVAMTEKKYVRKPKGAAPGSVVVEREKVIFAEPALPQPEE